MPPESNSPLPAWPLAWDRLIEAVDPGSLLVVIDERMGAALKRDHPAEDILQDALMHAWRDRHQLEWRGIKSFRSWLLTIIDHRIHDAADRSSAAKRSDGRRVVPFSALGDPGMPSGATASDFPADSTTPSKLAMYREQAEMMKAALDGMPEELREVVRLRLFEQLPLEEIARRVGIGASAVRHRFRKGSETYLKRLRTAMSGGSATIAANRTPVSPAESSPMRGDPQEP